MLEVEFRKIKDSSEHLLALSGIMGHPMAHLRAHHFRTSERSLAHLNRVFGPELAQQFKEWESTRKSCTALTETLSKVQELEASSSHLQGRLANLEADLEKWKQLGKSSQKRLRELVESIKQYLERPALPRDKETFDRFEVYEQLKSLVPYAEEVDHLCAAVKHYANREAYEAEKTELELKMTSAEVRHKSVRRGFFLSLFLCFLVVTIPLCVPFAFSLWNRMREIDKHLAQHTEGRRRVLRKLELAEEGVVAAEDITAVLGERSLSDVRSVLLEVRSLHREFGQITDRTDPYARVLILRAQEKETLEKVFGDGPKNPRENLAWILRSCEQKQKQTTEIRTAAGEMIALRQVIAKTLKGYNIEILRETVSRLEDRMDSLVCRELSEESTSQLTPQLARLCRNMPALLSRAQSALSRISYGHEVTHAEWQSLNVDVVAASTTLNAIALDHELAQMGGGDEYENNCINEETHGRLGVSA